LGDGISLGDGFLGDGFLGDGFLGDSIILAIALHNNHDRKISRLPRKSFTSIS
jgi:hypothetical protein